jgi:hypothetical protein
MGAGHDDIRPFQCDPPQQEATVVQGVRHGAGRTRDGYDPPATTGACWPNGPDGWIQIANFVLMWLLVIASRP